MSEASNDLTSNSSASNAVRRGGIRSDPEAYKAYQREFMRRKRAEAKTQPSTDANGTNAKKPRPGGHKLRRANPDAPKRLCPPTPEAEKPHVDPDRPALRTEAIAAEICDRLSHGETLTKICKDAHLPSRTTVLRWVNDDPIFSGRFARARDLQFEHWADDLVDVAAAVREKPDQVPAARLDSENKRWLLARLKPSLYSEKFQADVTSGGQPLRAASDLDLAKALLAAMPQLLPAPTPIDAEAMPVESEGEQS